MAKKLISEEKKQEIESALEKQYGEKGEDWDILYATIRGTEYAFAIKAPSRLVWNTFRDGVDSGKTKNSILEARLAIDCLITDVEGVVDLKTYNEIVEHKVLVPTTLSGMVVKIATSGLVDAKKD